MNTVDPDPVHVGQGFNVRIARQKRRLKTPHLAAGCSLSFHSFAANNPPHGGIAPETVGVVHVFIAAKAPKHRLTERSRHAMPSVLAGTAVLENSPGNLGQAKGIVKFPVGEQPGVRSNLGTMEFKLQTAVEIDPQRGLSAFTRRVTWGASVLMCILH